MKQAESKALLLCAGFMLGLRFNIDDGGGMLL
jgi:hypothetical protein